MGGEKAVEGVERPPLAAPAHRFAAVPSEPWEVPPESWAVPPDFWEVPPYSWAVPSESWAVPPKPRLSSARKRRDRGCGRYSHPTCHWGVGAAIERAVWGAICTQLDSGVGTAIECWVMGVIHSRGGLSTTGTKDPTSTGSRPTMCEDPSSRRAGTCHHPRRRNSAGAHPGRSPVVSAIASLEPP